MIAVETGRAVAQAKADGLVTDAFAVQDSLVRQLLADLEVPVSESAAARIGARETSSMDAYRAMTEGRLKLESLDLSDNPRLTDKAAAYVKTLLRLENLFLNKTGLTDKGLTELKTLEALRDLTVAGTKVTAKAAEAFADEMPNLRAVRR